MKLFSMTPEQLTATTNVAKEALFAALERDGVVKDAAKLSQAYVIIIHEPGTLGKLLQKLVGAPKEGEMHITIAKVV